MTNQKYISNSRLKRTLYLVLGSVAVFLGSIGIVIPVLPTTPFLLLAAYCYLRSSQRLYQWLVQHRILGKYIYHYLEHKAVPLATKIGAILILWTSLGFSMFLLDRWIIRIVLAVTGVAVSVHILSLKTLRTEQIASEQQTDVRPFEDPLL